MTVDYSFPSQNNVEFDSFLSKSEQLLSDINKGKPSLPVITGDFNAGTFSRFSLTSLIGFLQLINSQHIHEKIAFPALI